MDSKITETPIATDSPRSVAIPFNIEGLNDSNMCDLNKVFQINFTYNVDLLKNLLEGILKFQKSTEEELEMIKEDNKEKNIKIRKLESKLLGIDNSNPIKIDTNEIKKEGKKQKNYENILFPKKNENATVGKTSIFNPKDEKMVLEVSDSNNDITNKIIVRNLNLFTLCLEKNK